MCVYVCVWLCVCVVCWWYCGASLIDTCSVHLYFSGFLKDTVVISSLLDTVEPGKVVHPFLRGVMLLVSQ